MGFLKISVVYVNLPIHLFHAYVTARKTAFLLNAAPYQCSRKKIGGGGGWGRYFLKNGCLVKKHKSSPLKGYFLKFWSYFFGRTPASPTFCLILRKTRF
jgi:hypothetical protein